MQSAKLNFRDLFPCFFSSWRNLWVYLSTLTCGMWLHILYSPGWHYVAPKSLCAVWGISPPPRLCKFSFKYLLTHFLSPMLHSGLILPPSLFSSFSLPSLSLSIHLTNRFLYFSIFTSCLFVHVSVCVFFFLFFRLVCWRCLLKFLETWVMCVIF